MIRVGLTGGYATGKSFVASELARLGCHVISADALGHQTLQPDGEAYMPVVKLFGSDILDPGGSINRKRLGALVFPSPQKLAQLNAIVHPAVFRLEEARLSDISRTDPHAIAVVEAAILIETGRYRVFDRIVLTVCDEATQIARGMQRDRLTAEQICARLERQMPLQDKIFFAHYVIDTGGTSLQTLGRVREVFEDLKKL